MINPLHSVDVVYVIGGGVENTDIPPLTHEVIGVNIETKEVFEPSDIIQAVHSPATAASLNRLAVCGGYQENRFMKYCQLYSPKDDRYAQTGLWQYFLQCFQFVVVVLNEWSCG